MIWQKKFLTRIRNMTHNKFAHYSPDGSIDDELKKLKTEPASHWEKRGEKMALDLFKYTYETVPAYKKFLEDNGINGELVTTIEDFKKLPTTTKDNYLRKY